MHLDAKRVIYCVGFLIMGLMTWWFTAQKNAMTQRMIEEIETGAPGGEKALAIVRDFEAALEQSLRQMERGEFAAAASTAYRPFSTFENLLMGRPKLQLENGKNLEVWFAETQASFSAAVADAYSPVLDSLSTGDLSYDEARSFVSRMPYVFKGNLERQFRTDVEAVKLSRVEVAANWVMIRAYGYGENFKAAVYDIIRHRWPADISYKLVIGRPMSPAEERVVAKEYQVFMDAETVRYESQDEAFKNRGSGKLLSSITVRWTDNSKNPDAITMNWDDLAPITVNVDTPEKISFRMDANNHRQLANFDTLEAEQRERVLTALEEAIAVWPEAKVLTSSSSK